MKAALLSNAFTRFLLRASIMYLVLFVSYQFVLKRYTHYDQKFIGTIITASQSVLSALGFKTFAVLQDRDIQVVGIDGSNGVWVGSNCNAITLFSLFAVFIIAYPGEQKKKLWFIPLGILAIHIINIFRVVALAIIAFKYPPEYLEFNHSYTFTILVYGFIFLLWMIWVNRFATPRKTHEAY